MILYSKREFCITNDEFCIKKRWILYYKCTSAVSRCFILQYGRWSPIEKWTTSYWKIDDFILKCSSMENRLYEICAENHITYCDINANCCWTFHWKRRDNGELPLEMMSLLLKNGRLFCYSRYVTISHRPALQVAICIKIDEFCIKNDGFCITNDECCTKNDEFCIKNDDRFCRRTTTSVSKQWTLYWKWARDFVSKTRNSAFKKWWICRPDDRWRKVRIYTEYNR